MHKMAHSPHARGVKQVLGDGNRYKKPKNRERKAIKPIKKLYGKFEFGSMADFFVPAPKQESLFPSLGRVGDEVT